MAKRASWLSITPEPERELPEAVAILECGGRVGAHAVAREAGTIEGLILRGNQRQWNRYLHHVRELIDRRRDDTDHDVARARAVAIAVLANHHNLLLALPGRGAQRTEADRRALDELLATTNEDRP